MRSVSRVAKQLLQLDTSDLNALVRTMSAELSERQVEILIWRVLKRGVTATRQASVQAITSKYQAKSKWVRGQMMRSRLDQANLSATIYVSGARGRTALSGQPFPAVSRGTNVVKGPATNARSSGRMRRKVRGRSGEVYLMSVRGHWSRLPVTPQIRHFMITRGPNAGRVYAATPRTPGGTLLSPVESVYRTDRYRKTRSGRRRITHRAGSKRMTYTSRQNERVRYAVGIGVPQMPMTRAAPEIQERVLEIMGARLEHEYQVVTGRIRTRKGAL